MPDGPAMSRIPPAALVATGVGLLAVAGIVLIGVFTGPPTPTTVGLVTESSTTSAGPTTTGSSDTTAPAPTTTTTPVEATSTSAPTTTPTTGSGIFDEVSAVSDFVGEFADAIAGGDVDFLYERLHPAVKATYEEVVCVAFIEEEILSLEDYRAIGPVTGPFDSEFGEFPVTTYEVEVAYTFDETDFESSASYSLTEGTVRWFAQCEA